MTATTLRPPAGAETRRARATRRRNQSGRPSERGRSAGESDAATTVPGGGGSEDVYDGILLRRYARYKRAGARRYRVSVCRTAVGSIGRGDAKPWNVRLR